MKLLRYLLLAAALPVIVFLLAGVFSSGKEMRFQIELNQAEAEVRKTLQDPVENPRWLGEGVIVKAIEEGHFAIARMEADEDVASLQRRTGKDLAYVLESESIVMDIGFDMAGQHEASVLQVSISAEGKTLLWRSLLVFSSEMLQKKLEYDLRAAFEPSLASPDEAGS